MHSCLGLLKNLPGLLLAATLLTGCLDGGGETASSAVTTAGAAATSISGTAATGEALAGSVDLVDANGITRSVTIGAAGAYSIDTTGLSAPFILRATGVGNGAGVVLFSFADGESGIFNITPLTHIALELLRRNLLVPPANVAALFEEWNAQVDPSHLVDLRAAMFLGQKLVNANLESLFRVQGLSPTTFDFLRTGFTPDRTGLDAVLDAISLDSLNGEQISMRVNGVPVSLIVGQRSTLLFNGELREIFVIGIDLTRFTIGDCKRMLFVPNSSANGPHGAGEQVCFSASSSELWFNNKVLRNPTQNTTVVLPSTAYLFTDSASGTKYEAQFNAGILTGISLWNAADEFLGIFTSAFDNIPVGPPLVDTGGGVVITQFGTGGGLVISQDSPITVDPDFDFQVFSGFEVTPGFGVTPGFQFVTGAALHINVDGVAGIDHFLLDATAPTSQDAFCANVAVTNSQISLSNALGIQFQVGDVFTVNSCTFNGVVGNVTATLSIASPVARILRYDVGFRFQ